MERCSLTWFADSRGLARAVAALWLEEIAARRRAGQRQAVALSGGRGARVLFEAVVELAREQPTRWDNVHFFWADERGVPPGDAASNFRLAQELLFAPLGIQDGRVHRIHGEQPPEAAATDAALELGRFVPLTPAGQPMLDLVFLGLGEDGHVASLFPGEAESVIANPAVYRPVSNAPKPPPCRVTLGYAALAAAREVWVLVLGAAKGVALRESFDRTGRTPLARVLQGRSHTRIFSDFPLR